MAKNDGHSDPGKKPTQDHFVGIGSYGPVPAAEQPRNGGHVNPKIQPNFKQPDAPKPSSTYAHSFEHKK